MTPSPITPGDSLAAVVADLEERGTRRDDLIASRIERLDAEMREALDIANQRGDEWRRKFNEDTNTIAELRAKLAACERLRHEWLARAASTTQRQYANRILDCANDLNNALASRAAGEK